MDLENKIREGLRGGLDSIDAPEGVRAGPILRKAKRRRLVSALTMVFGCLMVALLGFAAVGLVSPQIKSVDTETSQRRSGLVSGTKGEISQIASGQLDGQAWILIAYRQDVETGPGQEEAVCVEFQLEKDPNSPYRGGCSVDLEDFASQNPEALQRNMTIVLRNGVIVVGEVGRSIKQVSAQSAGATVGDGRSYSSPPELGLDIDFFVLFASSSPDSLVGYDSQESRVTVETLRGLYTVAVSKEGSGNGDVLARPTASSRSPEWINCGATCSAELGQTFVTFEATADDQSVFAGWSGACSGTEPCNLEIKGDLNVVARFEAKP